MGLTCCDKPLNKTKTTELATAQDIESIFGSEE
jgi:hypothetical protein